MQPKPYRNLYKPKKSPDFLLNISHLLKSPRVNLSNKIKIQDRAKFKGEISEQTQMKIWRKECQRQERRKESPNSNVNVKY